MSGVITGVTIGAGFAATGLAAAFFLGAAFLAGFFFGAAFLAAAGFLAATFLAAAGFLAAAFLAAGFFAAGFLAAGFFAAGFFAAGFLAAGFLAAGFFAAGFFAAGFFAAGFLAAAIIKLLSMVGPNCLYLAPRWIATLPRLHSVERLNKDRFASRNWVADQPHSTRTVFNTLIKTRQQQHEHLVKRILLQMFFRTPVLTRVKCGYLHTSFLNWYRLDTNHFSIYRFARLGRAVPRRPNRQASRADESTAPRRHPPSPPQHGCGCCSWRT
jgi:MFS family permease